MVYNENEIKKKIRENEKIDKNWDQAQLKKKEVEHVVDGDTN